MLPRMLLRCSLLLVLQCLTSSAQAPGPCRNAKRVCVSALQTDFQGSAPSTVYVTRFGTTGRDVARRGMLLDPGDLLESEGAGAAAELSCPRSASLNFSGAFRTVVVDPQDRDCAVNLLSGSLDVLTSDPTQAQAGDITMGSEHTTYGLHFVLRDGRPAAEAALYDGDVKVFRAGRSQPLVAGWKLPAAMAEPVQMQAVDFDRAAIVWARLDLARAQVAGTTIENPAATYSRLHATYASVLANPADADARINLAGQQVLLAIPGSALVHLNRAETQKLAPPQAALLQFTKAAAFERLGDRQQAVQSYERAVRIDPEIPNKAEHLRVTLFVQPAVRMPGALAVRANANPATVAPGAATRILVQVVSQQNSPMPGVAVTVSAGGGSFQESGGTQVTGYTDANGQFATHWSCSPCAASYVLAIEARNPAFQPATAQLTVAIR
jgi:tetratricopeptide (TPR) repeat protein